MENILKDVAYVRNLHIFSLTLVEYLVRLLTALFSHSTICANQNINYLVRVLG